VEELGLRMHKFSDRWISCFAGTEEPVKVESRAPMRTDFMRIVLACALVLIRTVVFQLPIHFR